MRCEHWFPKRQNLAFGDEHCRRWHLQEHGVTLLPPPVCPPRPATAKTSWARRSTYSFVYCEVCYCCLHFEWEQLSTYCWNYNVRHAVSAFRIECCWVKSIDDIAQMRLKCLRALAETWTFICSPAAFTLFFFFLRGCGANMSVAVSTYSLTSPRAFACAVTDLFLQRHGPSFYLLDAPCFKICFTANPQMRWMR